MLPSNGLATSFFFSLLFLAQKETEREILVLCGGSEGLDSRTCAFCYSAMLSKFQDPVDGGRVADPSVISISSLSCLLF